MDKPNLEPQYIVDELTAICNSLGKIDENDGTYMKSSDCKPCLREIIRFLKADTDQHVARCLLGALNVIKTDFIPLMIQYCNSEDCDSDLFAIILRLCTNLTSNILLLFENETVPTEPEIYGVYQQLLNGLFNYKEAFASNDEIWVVLNHHLISNTDEEIGFERLIILIRNILHMPVDKARDEALNDGRNIQDLCLLNMDKSGMLKTLIKLASESDIGTTYCFHIMEIVYLIFRDQNPEVIGSAKATLQEQKSADVDSAKSKLAEFTQKYRKEKGGSSKILYAPSRLKHARFEVQNCRSLSERPVLTRQVYSSEKACQEIMKLDQSKVQLRKARNKKPISVEDSIVISDKYDKRSVVSYSLRVFCTKFVEQIYNNYMLQIKHNLMQKKTQESDELYYLWSIQFFVAFNRFLRLPIDNVSESLSHNTLHFIQVLVMNYQDKLKLEKKKFHDVSEKLHMALRAYREIIEVIYTVDPESPYATVCESIKKKIFHENEYCFMILNLFLQYDEPKHSIHYPYDLIKSNHLFLDLYEKYGGTSHLINKHCCPEVLKIYINVLKNHRKNDEFVNLAILRFFERIVYDCKNEVILFNATFFKVLLEVMETGQERFISLGKHLFEAFGAMFNKRSWLVQELLFLKTNNDVVEIEAALEPPRPPSPVPQESETQKSPDPNPEPHETAQQLDAELDDELDDKLDDELGNEVDDELELSGTTQDVDPTPKPITAEDLDLELELPEAILHSDESN